MSYFVCEITETKMQEKYSLTGFNQQTYPVVLYETREEAVERLHEILDREIEKAKDAHQGYTVSVNFNDRNAKIEYCNRRVCIFIGATK